MRRILIITPCSDRKNGFTPDNMRAATLTAGTIGQVATEWLERLRDCSATKKRAIEVYAGRSFHELRKAQSTVSADLTIISAGLGIVHGSQKIPNYGITVSKRASDTVFKKISNVNTTATEWWESLKQSDAARYDFNKIQFDDYDLVLLILSKNYAGMVRKDLERISEKAIAKLRIFGVGIKSYLPETLHSNLLAYDQRLNGPDFDNKGTMADLSARCVLDFCKCISENKKLGVDLKTDRAFVEHRLVNLRYPEVFSRQVLTDDEVKDFILQNLETTKGRVSQSLRLLRDCGYACEQSRFSKLFACVRENSRIQGEFKL